MSERLDTEQRRAQAGRELKELLAQIHAKMPVIPPEEEEEVERMIQREVDAVRKARAKQMLRQASQLKQRKVRK